MGSVLSISLSSLFLNTNLSLCLYVNSVKTVAAYTRKEQR